MFFFFTIFFPASLKEHVFFSPAASHLNELVTLSCLCLPFTLMLQSFWECSRTCFQSDTLLIGAHSLLITSMYNKTVSGGFAVDLLMINEVRPPPHVVHIRLSLASCRCFSACSEAKPVVNHLLSRCFQQVT